MSKHIFECTHGLFKTIPIFQTDNYLQFTTNQRKRFFEKYKPTSNKS